MGKSEAQLDLVFSALSDPTRRAVLARLRQGEASLTRLARPLQVSLPSMSKHVRVLERAGLIDRRIAGRLHRLRLKPRAFQLVDSWLHDYASAWEGQLDGLEQYLRRERRSQTKRAESRR
jgi:DNA-binding transcriptional ArsR family regulator